MPFVSSTPKLQNKINNIGAYYRSHRINDGLSLVYVADSIGINKGFLSDLENGKRHFPEGTVQQLNEFYGIQFEESQTFYNEITHILETAFNMLFLANETQEANILKNAILNTDKFEHTSGYFIFQIIKLHYYLRINKNDEQVETLQKLLESNLDALSQEHLSIFYCLLGIYYKRQNTSIFLAEAYLNKSIELSTSNSKTYAYSLFQLISLYGRTNRNALSYSYCEKSRNVFTRLNNYTTMFYIDFFQCNCLISMELYESAIQKLTELVSNINQSSNKYISTIYHSLAWCYLLNNQYDECIKYTNLAIENKDSTSDLCYFIPYSYYKQNEYLKCLDYIESHYKYADDFYKPFLQAISARVQKQNDKFESIIISYYQSLLQNNLYEDMPLIQNFILDYYKEINNKDMMIKILMDIKSFNDKNLSYESSYFAQS